ncbi:hypothetical protein L7F22_036361 [Adiantum nelumboides]|nr:hypothetical protein [Adiantum nelumboides]
MARKAAWDLACALAYDYYLHQMHCPPQRRPSLLSEEHPTSATLDHDGTVVAMRNADALSSSSCQPTLAASMLDIVNPTQASQWLQDWFLSPVALIS